MAMKPRSTSNLDRPRLSLLAQYDDIVRYRDRLTNGIEKEMIVFIKKQEENRLKWCKDLKTIRSLEEQLTALKGERNLFKTKWENMKLIFDMEEQKRVNAEKEKRSLLKQIDLIKEVLLSDQNGINDQTRQKLFFLNTQKTIVELSPRRQLDTIEESIGVALSPSEYSYDKTDEDLDFDVLPNGSGARRARRSRSKRYGPDGANTIAKKPRLHEDSFEEDLSSTSIHLEVEANGAGDMYAEVIPRSNRCCSEPVPSSETIPRPRQICKSADDPLDGVLFIDENVFPRTIANSTPIRRLSSTGRLNRNHVFCTKTVIRPECCFSCGRRIKFYKQALKCQDCRVVCHTECKEKVPLPCYPTMQTPTGKGICGTVADYAPSTPPCVPALIVHCIHEIESRGLNEVGLYRVSGAEKEVKELKEKFLKGKSIPCLSKLDIHAICGTVKEFLRSLHEPLITKALWQEFMAASEMQRESEQLKGICDTVNKLPLPNRDTLAFLIGHLNVITTSPKCKMPSENLAKVFGPTIVGYSSADPSSTEMLSQLKFQCKLVHLMMKVPDDFWRSFFPAGEDVPSPEVRTAPAGSRLGPISSSGYGSGTKTSRGVVISKVSYTPRGNIPGSLKTRQRFFNSPLAK